MGSTVNTTALEGITTGTSMPAPDVIKMNNLLQGSDGGLQVLVSYIPGSGYHATRKQVKWMVEGVDGDFAHSAPLDPSGNTLGPFVVGNVVKVLTEEGISAGTRSTVVRTIMVEKPV